MSLFQKSPLAIALLTIVSSNALAQEATLSTVTVEGDVGEDNSIIQSIDRDEIIATQPTQISDVLNKKSAVDVGGSSAINSVITVRGVPDYQLNVTVDGARQEGYLFHHGGDYAIDPELLKQVDINVGTNTIRDVDSLAGSIAFETVDASDLLTDGKTVGGSVSYGFATNSNASNYSASAYGRFGNQVDLLAYGHYMNGHEGESGDGTPIGNATEQKNGLVKASWDISDGQKLGVSYERYYNNAETYSSSNFGYLFRGSPQELSKYEIDRDTFNLSYDLNPSDNQYLDLNAHAYHTKTELTPRQDLTTGETVFGTNFITTKGASLENTAQVNLPSSSHEITVGAEFYRTNTESGRGLLQKLNHQFVYLEDKIGLFGDKFELTPGIRYDHYKTDYLDLDESYSKVSFALAARYYLNDDLSVYTAMTDIYQAPPMSEVALWPAYTTGHEADAETKGRNYQVGIDYQRQGLFSEGDNLTIAASYFYTDYNHYVDIVDRVYTDVGDAHTQGAEFKIGYDIGGFSSALSYSRSRSEIDATGMPTQVRGDMGDTFNLNLGYEIPNIDTRINWNSRLVKGLNTLAYSSGSKIHKDGYGVSDISLTYKPKSGSLKGMTVTAGVYNLFDKDYTDHASYFYSISSDKSIGRNARINLRYDF